MFEIKWFQIIAAALGGGLSVKIFDVIYQELRRRSDRSRAAKKFVDGHLDPLLKAADELVGKLRSLGESDFTNLDFVKPTDNKLESTDLAGVLFLFGRFWARIEIIRHLGISIAMSEDRRGQLLQNFLDCLESRRVRIVDRIGQRAIGEVLIEETNGEPDVTSFIRFVAAFESDPGVQRWMAPLIHILTRTKHTRERQQLLVYGIIVHALIDTLDPGHVVTRDRPSFPNKISKKSWRSLKYRIFKLYLAFVPNQQKYLGPAK